MKASDGKAPETKPVDAKTVDVKPVPPKPAEAKAAEAKPTEAKTAEAKIVEARPTDVKRTEIKPTNIKPSETGTAETRPSAASPRVPEIQREQTVASRAEASATPQGQSTQARSTSSPTSAAAQLTPPMPVDPPVQSLPPAPVSNSIQVRVSSRDADTTRIALSLPASTPLAVFERAGVVWIAAESPLPFERPHAENPEALGSATIRRSGKLSILQVAIPKPTLVRAAVSNGSWVVTLGDSVPHLPTPSSWRAVWTPGRGHDPRRAGRTGRCPLGRRYRHGRQGRHRSAQGRSKGNPADAGLRGLQGARQCAWPGRQSPRGRRHRRHGPRRRHDRPPPRAGAFIGQRVHHCKKGNRWRARRPARRLVGRPERAGARADEGSGDARCGS